MMILRAGGGGGGGDGSVGGGGGRVKKALSVRKSKIKGSNLGC